MYAVHALINVLAMFFFGVFVFLKNRQERVNRQFVIWTSITSLWMLGYCFLQMASTESFVLLWMRCMAALSLFVPVVFFHFIFTFLYVEEKQKIGKIKLKLLPGMASGLKKTNRVKPMPEWPLEIISGR